MSADARSGAAAVLPSSPGGEAAVAPSSRERRALAVARAAAVLVAIGAVFSPPLANAAAVVLLVSFALLPSAGARLRTAWTQPVVPAALLVLAALALATLWSEAPLALRWKYWWDWRVLLLLILALALFDDEPARRRALAVFVAAATVGALYSFWAWAQGVSTAPHHPGMAGTVLRNPVTQGMAFAVACFLAVVMVVADHGLARGARMALAAAAVLLAANLLFVTSGRTGHLLLFILLVAAAMQLMRGWRPRLAAVAAVPLAATLALAASPMLQHRFGLVLQELQTQENAAEITSMGIRVVMWRVTGQLVADAPLLGYGTGGFPGAYERAIQRSHYSGWAATPTIDPHNQYLLVQTQAGVLGSAAFLWFLVAGFRSGGPQPWRAAGRSMLVGWSAAALATSVFTAFAESHLLMPLLGMLLAPAAAARGASGDPAAAAPPPAPR